MIAVPDFQVLRKKKYSFDNPLLVSTFDTHLAAHQKRPLQQIIAFKIRTNALV